MEPLHLLLLKLQQFISTTKIGSFSIFEANVITRMKLPTISLHSQRLMQASTILEFFYCSFCYLFSITNVVLFYAG